ncbi:hypothetical protein MTO96_020522 [Rhipicephalus appendiculatus]
MLGPTTCICAHRMFPLLCLDGDLLEVNRMQLHFYNPTYLEGLDRNRTLRYTAYRLFVWWVWSRLGRGNRQPLPGCVLQHIRNACPSATLRDLFLDIGTTVHSFSSRENFCETRGTPFTSVNTALLLFSL